MILYFKGEKGIRDIKPTTSSEKNHIRILCHLNDRLKMHILKHQKNWFGIYSYINRGMVIGGTELCLVTNKKYVLNRILWTHIP